MWEIRHKPNDLNLVSSQMSHASSGWTLLLEDRIAPTHKAYAILSRTRSIGKIANG